MNLGASMLAKRVYQSENEESHFGRGLLIAIPIGIAMWVGIIWAFSVIFG